MGAISYKETTLFCKCLMNFVTRWDSSFRLEFYQPISAAHFLLLRESCNSAVGTKTKNWCGNGETDRLVASLFCFVVGAYIGL